MKLLLKKKNFVFGVFLFAFCLFYLFQTYMLPKGNHVLNSPQTLPYLLGIVLLILSIVQMKIGFNEAYEEGNQITNKMRLNGLFYIVATLLYILIGIPIIGFMYSSLIYMVILLAYYKEASWKLIALVPVGSLIIIYLVFTKMLLVRLP